MKFRLLYYSIVVVMGVASFYISSWLVQPWFQQPRQATLMETATLDQAAPDFSLSSLLNRQIDIEGDTFLTSVHPGESISIQNHAVFDSGTIQVLKVTSHAVVAKVHIVYWASLFWTKFIRVILTLLFLLAFGSGFIFLGYSIWVYETEFKKNPHGLRDFFFDAWKYVSTYSHSDEKKEYFDKILLIHRQFQDLDPTDKERFEEKAKESLNAILNKVKQENASRFSDIADLVSKGES